MNAAELKNLIESKHVTVLHHKTNKNADGTPQRWRLNGSIKLFKRDENRIYIPLKYGLYGYGKIESVAEFESLLSIPA